MPWPCSWLWGFDCRWERTQPLTWTQSAGKHRGPHAEHHTYETEDSYIRQESCDRLDDLHTRLRHSDWLFFSPLPWVGPWGGSRQRADIDSCFMSFPHCEGVSKWQREPAWPSLSWEYSAISAGNLSDSSPSSSSTWRLEASSSCTRALSGTEALAPAGPGSLWWRRRRAAEPRRQTPGGSASLAGCFGRRTGRVGNSDPAGWERADVRAGGRSIAATGTVHSRVATPKSWKMEEVR